ncbi:Hypothetical protein PHPALM_6777 [Phytophthora palmivora]|uniref:M96 mating-specific protein family n=1 Tax=Phytophthora palmivora TaxID=4796 RepID=A0A2P4YDY2_9STRA|nr:Hypothetical protein PHPALM_6777 [Phytophthora palmivora]
MSSSPSSDSPSEVGPRYHGVKRRDVTVSPPGLTKSGNKKRVRRIQKELPILRQEVQELELKLTRLQFQATSKQRTNTNDLNQKSQDGNLWNCIAERQLKERLRVEQEQLELKDLCNEVSKYSSELQTLFSRFEDCRERAIEDGVALVWSGVWDVIEYGGVKFCGMQLHKRGFVTLRPVCRQGPGQQSTSTLVETNFETIPVFDDKVTDQVHQVQTFSSVLTRSFNTANSTFCKMMSDLLLKEDWNNTFKTTISN